MWFLVYLLYGRMNGVGVNIKMIYFNITTRIKHLELYSVCELQDKSRIRQSNSHSFYMPMCSGFIWPLTTNSSNF